MAIVRESYSRLQKALQQKIPQPKGVQPQARWSPPVTKPFPSPIPTLPMPTPTLTPTPTPTPPPEQAKIGAYKNLLPQQPIQPAIQPQPITDIDRQRGYIAPPSTGQVMTAQVVSVANPYTGQQVWIHPSLVNSIKWINPATGQIGGGEYEQPQLRPSPRTCPTCGSILS